MSWRSLAFGLRENQAYLAVFVLCKPAMLTSVFLVNRHTHKHTHRAC